MKRKKDFIAALLYCISAIIVFYNLKDSIWDGNEWIVILFTAIYLLIAVLFFIRYWRRKKGDK